MESEEEARGCAGVEKKCNDSRYIEFVAACGWCLEPSPPSADLSDIPCIIRQLSIPPAGVGLAPAAAD